MGYEKHKKAAEALSMLEQNTPLQEIADKLGISREMVRAIAIDTKRAKQREEKAEESSGSEVPPDRGGHPDRIVDHR